MRSLRISAVHEVAVGLCAVAALLVAGCATAVTGSGTAVATSTAATVASSSASEVSSSAATAPSSESSSASTTSAPTVVTVTETVPPSSASTSATDTNDILGPFGWQTLTLGMTGVEARDLGMFVDTPAAVDVCQGWTAVGAAAIETAVISPDLGVVAIMPRESAVIHTPEGMTFGWTADQVAAAYPDFDVANIHQENGPTIEVPGNPDAHYRLQFGEAETLFMFTLELDSQNCYG